ncbi:MAG TPA: GNAT family N-acetyltransferase [Thermohalobaculum sp.]|nr:GNAT family N-acetyltransferase [Thermohalobaculum sp.]
MRLRPAGPEDLALLRHWDEQPHLQEIAGDPEFNDWDWENQLGRSVPWREMLIAVDDADGDRPIGFVQIIDPAREESHYWGEVPQNLRAIDIWIGEASDIGKGHGRRMMGLAIERCFADPAVTAILIDPMVENIRAHRFYEAMGFRFVERRAFGPDDTLVYKLERADWRERENPCPKS